jgi:hypothetical protein
VLVFSGDLEEVEEVCCCCIIMLVVWRSGNWETYRRGLRLDIGLELGLGRGDLRPLGLLVPGLVSLEL